MTPAVRPTRTVGRAQDSRTFRGRTPPRPLPLRGRSALVTGASRRGGIGDAAARRLAACGASVYLHHHVPHDAAQPWGAEPEGPEAVVAGVREASADPAATVAHGPGDPADPEAPAELIATAAEALGGRIDILVANHALSGSDGTLDTIDAAMVDTDHLSGDDYDAIAAMFPAGRWGMPDDPARLIAWLATDGAAWITGQVIGSEGGFRRG